MGPWLLDRDDASATYTTVCTFLCACRARRAAHTYIIKNTCTTYYRYKAIRFSLGASAVHRVSR